MLNPLKDVLTVEMVRSLIAKIKGALATKVSMGDVVSSWQSTPDDAHVPTEKLVKDTLDNLPPGTAVKGDAESEFRTGNVNLTPANIGAATASQGDKADTAVQGVKVNGTELSKDSNNKVSIPDGTTAQKGVVQLSNAIDSTSTTEAATPKAVKDAYDDLNNKIVARAVFLSQAEWAVQSQIPGDPAKVYYVENGTGEDAYTVYVWKESTSEYVEVDESSIDLDGYWHDVPTTTGSGNVVTDISLGNDGVPQMVKGITALTQHQSVTDNNPTLGWNTTSKVGKVGSTDLQVTMPANPAQNLPASVITSGTFGTDRIADDAITAAKVKDNETLPVDVSGTATHLSAYGEWSTWDGTYVSSTPFALIGEQTWPLTNNNGDGSILQFERNNDLLVRLKLYIVTSGSSVSRVEAVLLEITRPLDEFNDLIKITYFTYTSNNTQYFAIRLYVKFTGNWQNWRVRQLDCQTADNGYLNWREFPFRNGRGSNIDSTVGTPALMTFTSPFAKQAVGSTSIPVYVDSNGQVQPCDPSQMSVSSATTATNYASGGGIDSALSGKADKANITGATKCKITYNSQGIVTAGNDLSASDIPSLATSKITSGTFGTSFIADDAITADKVKDNETLPVNVSGGAASASVLSVKRILTSSDNIDELEDDEDFVYYHWLQDSIPSGTLPGPGRITTYGYLLCEGHSNRKRQVMCIAGNTQKIYTRQCYARSGGALLWTSWLALATVYGGGAGSTSTPVYVDANGQVQACTPSSMYVGWASNVNLSKTVNSVNGDSIQAGTGTSVTIGNAGNAKTWDSWKIAVDAFGTSTDTIYFY